MFKSSAIGQILDRASAALTALYPARQAAALCYRMQGQEIQVLLITGRQSGRWGFPKGTIEFGETALDAAEREAFEEAGVSGKGFAACIGRYQYRKNGHHRRFDVQIHALAVAGQADDFPEKGQRQMRWASVREAALAVDHPALKELLKNFVPRRLIEEIDRDAVAGQQAGDKR